MGADNWAKCPKCLRQHELDIVAGQRKLGEAYGKASPDEFLAMFEAQKKLVAMELEPTLREDYFQGMGTDGVYRVSYSAHCNVCKWSFESSHTEVAFDPKAVSR